MKSKILILIILFMSILSAQDPPDSLKIPYSPYQLKNFFNNTVDKTSSQNIVGPKLFSNSKTTFGTTESDTLLVNSGLFVNGYTQLKRYKETGISTIVYDPDNNISMYILKDQDEAGMMRLNFGGSVSPYIGISKFRNWINLKSDSVTVTGDINITGNIYRNGILYNQGSVSNADALGGIAASEYVTKSGLNGWSGNLYSSSANQMTLGKLHSNRIFNNGAYGDFWIIDRVTPQYNLSANWLYTIEHRTDYYEDTLSTLAHADILNIAGTPPFRWKTNDVQLIGNEIQLNMGNLPDSSTLNWTYAGLFGNRVTIKEIYKTTASRFPMPVYGYHFSLGAGSYYKYPKLYSYYSNLVDSNTNEIEQGYHFYGKGNFPSYFGGNIEMPIGSLVFNNGASLLTQTELGYIDGVTSSVQAQLNNKQTINSNLTTIAGLTATTDNFLVGVSNSWASRTPSQVRTTLGLVVGTNIQAYDPDLVTYSNITPSANVQSFLGAADYATMKTLLGVGSADTAGTWARTNQQIEDYISNNSQSVNGTAATLDSVFTAFRNSQTINGTAATLDSIITAFRNGTLGNSINETQVNNLISLWMSSNGESLIGTRATIDSIITAFWAGTLGGSPSSNVPFNNVVSLKDTIDYLNNKIDYLISLLNNLGVIDEVKPPKPTSFEAVGGTYTDEFTSTWVESGELASNISRIRFYAGSTNDTTSLVLVDSVNAGIMSYRYRGLTPNTTYWCAVKAVDIFGKESYFSNRDSATTKSSGGTVGAKFDSCGTSLAGYDNNTFAFDNYAQVGVNYTPNTGNKTLGGVSISINQIIGNLSSVNFEAAVHLVGSGGSLGTLVATSTARNLTTGWCQFSFTSGVTLTNNTQYFIVVRRVDKSFSGTNYAYVNYGTDEWTTGLTGTGCEAQLWYGTTNASANTYSSPYSFRLYGWNP